MRKIGVLFLSISVLFISFIQLSAFSFLEKQEVKNEIVREKRDVKFKINEEDFINTMFLRSTFFENGSETNYFVNPILKTSQSLFYNENGYLDFLKDSYATGIVFDKPSDKFLELYQNGDNYVKQYKLDRFYNVDKKFFLKDLTNFMYTYALKYQYVTIINEFEQSIKNLEQVKFNEDNGEIVDINGQKNRYNFENEFKKLNNKGYFFIESDTYGFNKYLANNNSNNIKQVNGGNGVLILNNGSYAYFDASKIKSIYYGNEVGEPIIPEINEKTGEIIDGQTDNEGSGFGNLIDVVVAENVRVQQGGSANYDFLDQEGTQKIIFDFEIIDESDEKNFRKVVYRMILTINKAQIIRAGSISLTHYLNEQYDADKLNFKFDFNQSALNDENYNPLGVFEIENYIYLNHNKIVYDRLEGYLYLNAFLKQFFSNALVPVFSNRGAFMEASYLQSLNYNTVLVNFLGLRSEQFLSAVKLHQITNNKVEQNQKDEIDFKSKGKNILNSTFKIMNNFYKNYLRTIFDLENRTYIQGYNKKFGLLVSNGFKIYPKYFYFSDKYQKLDVTLYSSHANKFYQTKYGTVFNYDYSVYNNFKVDEKNDYLFNDDKEIRKKYWLRYKELLQQKVGYGVFELQAEKQNEFYRYYDFNFGIYNGKDLTSLLASPKGQGGNEQYESCSGYNMACHLKNGAIWVVNNLPGVKQVNELANGIAKIFETTYKFFNQIFEVGKFNLDFYIVITNIFLLIIFMKFIRMF